MPPKKAAPKKAAPKKVAPKKSAAAEKEPSPKSAGKKAPAESKSKKAAKAAEQAVAQPPSPPAAAVKGKKAPGKTPLETAAAAPAPPAKQAKAEGPRRAPVDREVPNRGNFKVVEGYDVLLNQTNVGSNNNKFYIIQVLQDDKGNYYAWNRWGRIPEPGQNKLDPCGPNLAAAVKSFESKFREKTQCAWANRANFKKVDGKYGIVEKEDPADDGNGESGDASAPMGKLSRSQIEKGQAVLERLHTAISAGAKPGSAEIERLSSEFFTLIPTNFGRQRPVPITTLDQVNQKDALLKFYLRMGFEEVEDKTVKQSPIAGVMQLPLPSTLLEAVGAACPSASVKQAVDKGAALVPKKAGDPIRPVDKELYGAILLYTSNAIYRQLNQALREEKISAVKKYHSYLRMLFHAADSFKQKSAKLWRGVSVDLSKQYKVGDVITWWSVSSCTSEMSVAKGFAGGCASDSTVLTIDTKTACDISAVTYYSNEKESILLPGTKLLVKSVSKTGKVAEIHMEEVGRAVD